MATGDMINHYGVVKIRASCLSAYVGTKPLIVTFRNPSGLKIQQLAVMNFQPVSYTHVLLSNYTEESAQLELKCSTIDAPFVITRIIVYLKPIATSNPM